MSTYHWITLNSKLRETEHKIRPSTESSAYIVHEIPTKNFFYLKLTIKMAFLFHRKNKRKMESEIFTTKMEKTKYKIANAQ